MGEGDLYGTNFSIESMKVIAESVGIGNLQDEAAKELADDISFRLKHIIQDAAKFMNHAKRVRLVQSDVDSALKVRNIEVSTKYHKKLVWVYLMVLQCAFSPNMGFILQNHFHFVLHLEVVESCILLRRRKST